MSSQPPWVQVCSVIVPAARIEVGDRRPRLDRVRDQAVVDHPQPGDVGRLGERRLDRGAVAELPVEAQVVRDVVVNQRPAGGGGGLGVGDHVQGFVVDRDQLGRVLGLAQRLGHHERDVVADVADPVGAQHRPQLVLALGAVPVLHRDAARQQVAAGRLDVRAGDHREHAGRRSRGLDVDRPDPGVGLGRAHDAAIDLALEIDIVGVAPRAGNEPLILDPAHRLTDPELRHDAGSPR